MIGHPLEINSNAGICSSGAQAMVNAARAVKSEDAKAAAVRGGRAVLRGAQVEGLSHHLRSSRPSCGMSDRRSGSCRSSCASCCPTAPAHFCSKDSRGGQGLSLKVNWTYSRSFANEAPLCMQLPEQFHDPEPGYQESWRSTWRRCPRRRWRARCARMARRSTATPWSCRTCPRITSNASVRKIMDELSPHREVPYWTNLRTAGNTGAASIFIMLDEYLKTQPVATGDRILLFVPESGQFNYVLISLTVVFDISVSGAWLMKIAVIGAGSSGLVTLKYLLDTYPAADVVCFEKGHSVRGCWGDQRPDFVSTSTKYTTQFSCFRKWSLRCVARAELRRVLSRRRIRRLPGGVRRALPPAEAHSLRRRAAPSGLGDRSTGRSCWSDNGNEERRSFDAVFLCTGLVEPEGAVPVPNDPDDGEFRRDPQFDCCRGRRRRVGGGCRQLSWRNRNTTTRSISRCVPASGSARAITRSAACPSISCATGCCSPSTRAYGTGSGNDL